jgi:hypothetical protein
MASFQRTEPQAAAVVVEHHLSVMRLAATAGVTPIGIRRTAFAAAAAAAAVMQLR